MAVVTIDKTIFIGANACRGLKSLCSKHKWTNYFIICDSNTLVHCLSRLVVACPFLKEAEIIELEPGEESKDIDVIASIWQTLTELGADKKSLIINLGGGVISDAGAFAASTFKRGIDFINVPTSLLAMADASVGGKNGINFSGIKNTIGTITQPNYVFIDPAFLETLPPNHLANGFAEIFKIALIRDKTFFKAVSAIKVSDLFNDEEIITRSVSLKNKIVKKDPTDKGLRKILNFGHTVGHAVESLAIEKKQAMLHGEAVAIGMAIESYLCFLQKRISKKELEIIITSLHLNFKLPLIAESDFESLFRFMSHDKKNTGSNYLPALLRGIGKCDPVVKIGKSTIEKAIQHYNKQVADDASL